MFNIELFDMRPSRTSDLIILTDPLSMQQPIAQSEDAQFSSQDRLGDGAKGLIFVVPVKVRSCRI
jgi:hypothetical protein